MVHLVHSQAIGSEEMNVYTQLQGRTSLNPQVRDIFGELYRQTVSIMQSRSIASRAVNQQFFFRTGPLQCPRAIPQRLMFLILLDGPHMQSWTSAHSLSTFQPPRGLPQD